jgi:hypothetical protein
MRTYTESKPSLPRLETARRMTVRGIQWQPFSLGGKLYNNLAALNCGQSQNWLIDGIEWVIVLIWTKTRQKKEYDKSRYQFENTEEIRKEKVTRVTERS